MGKTPKISTIQAVVAESFGTTVDEMIGRKRGFRLTVPRQVAFFLSRKHGGRPYQQIGRVFRRHHSTVMYGVDRISYLMKYDPALAKKVEAINDRLTEKV